MANPFPRTFFLKLIKVSAEEEDWVGMVDRDRPAPRKLVQGE
jgi:hypothetical protein